MTKLKILVSDDDSSIRALLKIVLEDEGYEVITAGDGKEAIAKANELNPDCIVLDVTMPLVDGFEVLGILRTLKTEKHIPIIILSARDKMDDKLRGVFQGADAYLTKPFNLDILKDTIKEVLKNKEKKIPD